MLDGRVVNDTAACAYNLLLHPRLIHSFTVLQVSGRCGSLGQNCTPWR